MEVPLYEREWEIGLTALAMFWLLSQFAHSHPFESRIIEDSALRAAILQGWSPTAAPSVQM